MIKSKAPNQYDIQAAETMQTMGIQFRAVFIFHGRYWECDKETRNVWELILSSPAVDCNVKTVSFRFGQSIADSFYNQNANFREARKSMVQTTRNVPTAYDLIACLTKSDPGTFSDFCGDMGLDTDSRKAEKTYFAVQEEWEKVRGFFKPEELVAIREIN